MRECRRNACNDRRHSARNQLRRRIHAKRWRRAHSGFDSASSNSERSRAIAMDSRILGATDVDRYRFHNRPFTHCCRFVPSGNVKVISNAGSRARMDARVHVPVDAVIEDRFEEVDPALKVITERAEPRPTVGARGEGAVVQFPPLGRSLAPLRASEPRNSRSSSSCVQKRYVCATSTRSLRKVTGERYAFHAREHRLLNSSEVRSSSRSACPPRRRASMRCGSARGIFARIFRMRRPALSSR